MKAIKVIILLAVLGVGILPSIAKIDGGISENHFYDTEKTIMNETPLNKTLKTEKYWEKNLLYFSKYRPIFMLSNKELIDMMPKENISVVQRIATPAVYSISLKTASIKTISLSPANEIKSSHAKKQEITKTDKNDFYNLIYEQAKSDSVDSDAKIETVLTLKETKTASNYAHAIDLLNIITEQEPYNAYAYYLKGEIYSAKKDYEKAMKNYVEALKINPTSKQCCLGIAKILEPTNKELAQKYYAKAK